MVLQMAWQNSALPTLVRASNLDCQVHNASSVRPLWLGVRNSINDFIPTGQTAEKTNITDNNFNIEEETLDRIVNTTTIIAEIKQFQPVKSPGADDIYPILLQKGISLLALHLERIFKMSLTSGRIAEPWKTVKTVFIPKPRKEDYNTAKSFRPISLMSFILKTLECLIFWFINDTHMVANPLSKNVYSYREGVSTETALHRLTYQIEKALANKQFAMVIFLDI